jgi:hypothetical protein
MVEPSGMSICEGHANAKRAILSNSFKRLRASGAKLIQPAARRFLPGAAGFAGLATHR